MVRSRVELGDNRDVGQAILAVEDDVVDLVVELATGGFSDPSQRGTLLELCVFMEGLGRHDELYFLPC